MIKKNLKTLIITSIIILLPIAAGLLLWDQLPAQMPTHWNANGEVDGWSSKPFAVFGFPAIMLAVQWLCVLATGADPKKKNHTEKVMNLILWIIPVLNLVLQGITYAAAMGKDMPVEMIVPIFMAVLFVAIGNYLPKCKQSYTIGIKIPWTLNSEENWNRTHRLAGRLWVVCGVAMAMCVFLGELAYVGFLGLSLIMVVVPIIYSYTLYKKGI